MSLCPCCGQPLPEQQQGMLEIIGPTTARVNGQLFDIHLTPHEVRLLLILIKASQAGEIVPTSLLYERLYEGARHLPDRKIVNVLIRYLRKKLEHLPITIQTFGKRGYLLIVNAP